MSVEFSIDFAEIEKFNDLDERVKERVVEMFEDSGESTDLYDAFERRCYDGIKGSPYDILRQIVLRMLEPLIRRAKEEFSDVISDNEEEQEKEEDD